MVVVVVVVGFPLVSEYWVLPFVTSLLFGYKKRGGRKRQNAIRCVYCLGWSWLREGHAHTLGPHRFHCGSKTDETGSFLDVGCIGLPGSCYIKARLIACPTGVVVYS